jgi:phosphoribosylformylglycinamidine synthase
MSWPCIRKRLAEFEAICERERCLFAVLGEATEVRHLQVKDEHFGNSRWTCRCRCCWARPPRMLRQFDSRETGAGGL